MTSTDKERRDAMLDRVLARGAQALGTNEANVDNDSQFDLAERAALKRVAGLSTELEYITEV
ncbi:MAG: GTPase HflX, partial [Brevibacterium sp.]|nr:GTPase HflX [Brevibacterium sp.]